MNQTGAPRLSHATTRWLPRSRRWARPPADADLLVACATALLLPIASSFVFHLANLRLSDEGTSAFMIGVSAGIQALGISIAAPFTPVVARVIGGRAAILLSVLCAVGASLMLMSEERAFGSQAAGRALLAVGIAFIYTTGESLVVGFPRLRSKVDGVGLYSTLLAAGAALGPLCVAAVGTRGDLPGAIGILLFAAAAAPLLIYLSRCSASEFKRPPGLGSLRSVWLALAVVFIFGFLESGAVGMLSLHGLLQGHKIGVALSGAAVAGIAAMLLQYPISRLAERANTRILLCVVTLTTIVGIYLVPMTSESPLALFSVAFVLGGLLDGFYTIGLILFASSLTSGQCAGGNGYLVGICGLGEIVGPIATGAGMSAWGPIGLQIVVASVLIGFFLLVFAGYRHPHQHRAKTASAVRLKISLGRT